MAVIAGPHIEKSKHKSPSQANADKVSRQDRGWKSKNANYDPRAIITELAVPLRVPQQWL